MGKCGVEPFSLFYQTPHFHIVILQSRSHFFKGSTEPFQLIASVPGNSKIQIIIRYAVCGMVQKLQGLLHLALIKQRTGNYDEDGEAQRYNCYGKNVEDVIYGIFQRCK